MSGARILVVDDEVAIAETLQDFFEGEGFVVDTAANGVEGLAVLIKSPPALVITDVMMPLLDGPGMVAKMRATGFGHIPVVFMSAARRHTVIPKELDADPGIAFLRKPFEWDELLALVTRFLDEK